MLFTEKELEFIHDQDFLLTKVQILKKVRELLESTRLRLHEQIRDAKYSHPKECIQGAGKISRGENYRSLPYLVLDYPADFSKPDIFALRTMFWWGHFYSITLHLQGYYLEKTRVKICRQIMNIPNHAFICVHPTPWEYHYGADNYVPLQPTHVEFITNNNFLKLSWKYPLKKWRDLPELAAALYAQMSKILWH